MNKNQQASISEIENDEITLKDLILKVKEYSKEVRRNWWVLVLFIVPITIYMFYDAYKTKKTYKADLTFLVNDDGGNSLGLSAALGGLGDLAGGAKSKLDKIIELSKSRRILQTALFKKSKIDNITDFYANHLIRNEDLHKKWQKDTTGMKDFFYTRGTVDSFNIIENKVLLALQELLVGNKPIFSGIYDKKSEIMKLSIVTNNEELSINLLRVIYEDLSTYYVEKSTTKEERTYRIFRAKADSLKNLVRAKDIKADRFEDRNRGSLFLEDKREVERLKKEAYIYNTLYGETEKNMNLASFALESKVPYIQEIDLPIAPIKPVKKSKILAIVIGFFVGTFVGSILVILRSIVKKAMI